MKKIKKILKRLENQIENAFDPYFRLEKLWQDRFETIIELLNNKVPVHKTCEFCKWWVPYLDMGDYQCKMINDELSELISVGGYRNEYNVNPKKDFYCALWEEK